MIEKFYLENFEGKAGASSIIVPSDKTVRLPDQPCKFVMLARWNVSNDEAFTIVSSSVLNTDTELYYGFNGVVCCQLFISQTTQLIPVNNANQIIIRNPAKSGAEAPVYYAWFW